MKIMCLNKNSLRILSLSDILSFYSAIGALSMVFIPQWAAVTYFGETHPKLPNYLNKFYFSWIYISLYIIWSDSFGSECFWCDHGWMWTIVSTYSKCDHCQTPLIITIVNHMHGQPAAVFGSHVTNCNTELTGTF